MWCVEGQQSGEYREFSTKKQAKNFIKSVQEFDKRNNISGEDFDIWFEHEEVEIMDEKTGNMPCDNCGFCVGSSCKMFYKCYDNK